MSQKENEPEQADPSRGQLEREEAWLWRVALSFLVLLATALAAESWERLQSLPYHLNYVPIAVLLIAFLFAGFVYGRKKRVAELKSLIRGIEDRAAPSAEQIDQLSQAIIRSQK